MAVINPIIPIKKNKSYPGISSGVPVIVVVEVDEVVVSSG